MVFCSLIFLSSALAGLPVDSDKWLPLQVDGAPIRDDAGDTVPIGSLDLVGSDEQPVGFWSIDEDEVFFRVRLADSPLTTGSLSEFSCFPLQCAWGLIVEADAELTTYEYMVALPDGADALQVWSGSGVTGADAPPEDVLHSVDAPWPGEHLAVSSAASSIGSGDDVFLELAIPRTWLGLSSDDDLIQALPLTGLGPVSAGMEADAPEILSTLTLSEAWPDPIGMDGDGDGLRIDDEWAFGTDPQDPDTDDDGLDDKDEQLLGTDPLAIDTDLDGLTDGEEVHDWGTSPVDADTEGDGLTDGDEISVYGTDPFDPIDPDPSIDVDCDGLSDEVDPDTTLDPDGDADGDGLSNAAEGECGTDPCVAEPDHDLDGIETATELTLGHDPCDPASPDTDTDDDCDGIPDWTDPEVLPTSDDLDGDGIPNTEEETCGGDPCVAEDDTDGDGLSNADELSLGTDPCDASSPDQDRDEDCDGIADYLDDAVEFDPSADHDGDHITNGHELGVCNTDPCTPTPDPDGDGVPNEIESTCQTDPCNPDTDADGRWDTAELSGDDCGPDTNGNGVIDAIDPQGPTAPDPLTDDDSTHGLSGGALTGGGCSQSGSAASMVLSILALLTIASRHRMGFLAAILLAPSVSAANTVNAQSFRSATLQRTFLTLPDTTFSQEGWVGGLVLTQATNPLIYRVDSPDRADIHLLEQVWSADLTGGYTFERFALSLAAPVHVYARGQGESRIGLLGDLRLAGLYTLIDRRTRPVGVAVSTQLVAPTGSADLWLQQQTPSAAVNIHASRGSTVIGAATLGFEALGNAELAGTTIGSRALWGLAVHVPVTRSVGTSVEVNGSSYLTDLAKPGANPIEAIASGRIALSDQLTLSLGAGTALTSGMGGPALRTLAGLSFVPVAAVPPRKAESSSPKVAQAAAPAVASEGLLRISTADAAGEPVMAQFWIEGADTRTLTNADGIGLLSLPPGDHTLRVSASGYASIRRQMRIEPGVERDLLISLSGSRASIANDRIIIDDKVYFETGSADLLPKSHSLLDEIALLILDNAQLSLIEVQGHTDSVGRAQDNLTLSAERARAVMAYLVNAGVSDQRLTAKGMGEDVPIEVEDTEDARALNRRVEFHVQEASTQ